MHSRVILPNLLLVLNILSATAFRGLGAVATFLLTVVITRNFAVNTAGAALFSISLIMVCGQFFSLGSHQTATKLVGSNFAFGRYRIVNMDMSAITCYIIGLAGLLVLVSFAVNNLVPEYNLVVIVVGGAGFALIQLYTGAMIGCGKQKSATLFLNGFVPFLACLFILFAVSTDIYVSADELNAIYVISVTLSVVLLFYVWFRSSHTAFLPSIQISKATKQHLKAMYPAVLAQLSTQYVSQFAIAFYLTASDLAFFSSAIRVSLLISFVLMGANLVVAGQYAKYFSQKDIAAIDHLSRSVSRILLMIALPLCIAIMMFAASIMGVFGEEYSIADDVLRVLVLGQLVNVATGATNYILTMCGQEKALRNALYITFLVSVISAVVFTPFWGVEGAALATTLAVASQNLLAAFYVKKYLGFNPINVFRRV